MAKWKRPSAAWLEADAVHGLVVVDGNAGARLRTPAAERVLGDGVRAWIVCEQLKGVLASAPDSALDDDPTLIMINDGEQYLGVAGACVARRHPFSSQLRVEPRCLGGLMGADGRSALRCEARCQRAGECAGCEPCRDVIGDRRLAAEGINGKDVY